MLCVAQRDCQARDDYGKIITFDKGMVYDFKECPTNFEPVAEAKDGIDFSTATEEFLMAADFELSELKDYIEETFGIKTGNKGKEKTVKTLIDARYREL